MKELKLENGKFDCNCPLLNQAIEQARQEAVEEVLNFINNERDNGNCENHGFSPALCLSGLIKLLETKRSGKGKDDNN